MKEELRPRAFRIVVGFEPVVPGAHSRLACAASDRARHHGLARVQVKRSNNAASKSFYVTMVDAQGRSWKLRISDHYCPRRTEVPNFDFVSRDGTTGREQLIEIVDRIASGNAPWFDSAGTGRPNAQRRVKRHKPMNWERRR